MFTFLFFFLKPFFPALGTVHLSPSTTKTFHIIKTSLVKPSISPAPAYTQPQGNMTPSGLDYKQLLTVQIFKIIQNN